MASSASNPGSPTCPHNYDAQYGTIGFLDLDDGQARRFGPAHHRQRDRALRLGRRFALAAALTRESWPNPVGVASIIRSLGQMTARQTSRIT